MKVIENACFRCGHYETGVETAVRWPHETALEAAERFAGEWLDTSQFDLPGDVDVEGITARVAERLRPDVPAAPADSVYGAIGALASQGVAEGAQLRVSAQMAVATAARHFGPAPRVLAFGAGRDTPLQCAAVTLGYAAPGTLVVVEEDATWAAETSARLAAFLADRGLPAGACEVRTIATPTVRAHWMDWVGRFDELANLTISRIFPEGAYDRFDVVLVDGPCGCNDLCAGRMAAISSAPALLKPGGAVFVDDLSRTVERVYANAVLRPRYASEALVENTVMNHFRYYTDDATLACVVPPGANIPMAVADFNNLENVFRQGDADAVAARLDADDDDERAAGGAAMRRRIGELRRVGPPPPGALLAERRATPA